MAVTKRMSSTPDDDNIVSAYVGNDCLGKYVELVVEVDSCTGSVYIDRNELAAMLKELDEFDVSSL